MKSWKFEAIILFILIFSLPTVVYSQDEIIYKNKTNKFVDKILEINNDSIYCLNYKRKFSVPLSDLSGYYMTIDTEENLKKRYFKRERTYYPLEDKNNISSNELDPNKTYVIKQLNNLEIYDAKKFKSGYFIQGTDTTFCKIYENRKTSKNGNLFIVTLNDSGIKKAYTASEIDSYSINNDSYISYSYKDDNIETTFFIKLIIKGKFSLYERNGIPSNNKFTYYIKKENEDFFYIISTEIESAKFYQNSTDRPSNNDYSKFYYKSNDKIQEFKAAIIELFGSCESIRNKVNSGFFTQNDIPLIIKEYNNCK